MKILEKLQSSITEKYKGIKISDIKDVGYLRKRLYADTIFYNGVIETNDPDNPSPQILAVKDRFVVAATTIEEMSLLQNKKTLLVDLDGKTIRPGKILWDESFAYARDEEESFLTQLKTWSEQGVTSIFNYAEDIEQEIITRDILLDAMHAKITPVRYFGSLVLDKAESVLSVKKTLDSQAKICMSLDGIINFDTLCVHVDDTMDKDYLLDLFSTCGSKGYNIRAYAQGKNLTMICANALADVASSFTSFSFSIITDYIPTEPEIRLLDAPNLIFIQKEEMQPIGNVSPAKILGKEKFLGMLKEGYVADLCIFDNEECISSYLAGKQTYTKKAASGWIQQYMASQ